MTIEQKVTMASLRAISKAIEEYSIDNGCYPTASSIAKLKPLVVPRYTDELPRFDGWGGEFDIDCNPTLYTIASCGKGHTGACASACAGGCGETTRAYDDIIITNGRFVQWPKGAGTEVDM
jgi:type II secretory pathway pseudopilin PulG